MPKPADRVQLFKQESAAGGGDAADEDEMLGTEPIESHEDAPDVAGIYIQEDVGGGVSSADKQVTVYRESNKMYLEDAENAGAGRLSLSALAAGGFDIDDVLVDDITLDALADDITGNLLVNA